MILFVWSHSLPLYSGRGGSESYTVGQVRELMQRGIPVKIVTVGLGKKDGRDFFSDITFEDVNSVDEMQVGPDDTVIFVDIPHQLQTVKQSFVIMHLPPPSEADLHPTYATPLPDYRQALAGHTVIVNSQFSRDLWAAHLQRDPNNFHIVYPFADPEFARVARPAKNTSPTKVLYASRLNPAKGIYLFLESLHHEALRDGYQFAATTAGNQTEDGRMLKDFIRHHPWVELVEARHTPRDMAELFANYDVVVVPSNHTFWHEAFGMISVEAQHAGCRVVATYDGGLPETNCGGLSLFKPGDSYSLARAIAVAAKTGPLPAAARIAAARHFTRSASVDALLALISHPKQEIQFRAQRFSNLSSLSPQLQGL